MLLLHRGFDLCYKGSYGRFKHASGERGGKGMGMTEKTGLSGVVLGAVAGGVVVSLAVLGWQFWMRTTEAPAVQPVAAPVAPAPVPAAPAPAPVAVAPMPDPAAPPPGEVGVQQPAPPRFDTFRLGADGSAIVAGIGIGGAGVGILIDGAEVAQARVDSAGRFAAIFSLDPASVPRMLTLRLDLADGRSLASVESVVIAPVIPVPAVAELAPPPEPEPEADPAAPAAAPTAADAGMAESGPAEPPQAMAADTAAGAPSAEPSASSAPDGAEPPAAPPKAETELTADVSGDAAPPVPEPAVPEITTSQPAVPAPPAAVAGAPEPPAAAGSAAATLPAPAPHPPAVATAPSPQQAASGEAAPVAADPTPQPQPEAAPTQPASLLVSDQGVRVLRPATDVKLAIETISYSDAGAVRVAGRGGVGSVIRVYLNNAPQLDTLVDETGAWHGTLPPVDPGLYTLRADQVTVEGKVEARSETPFLREAPEALAAAAALATEGGTGDTAAQLVTVQPGFTLWGIARQRYGRGIEYVKVFEANRTQIRNPHLIYPGQVFSLPDPD